MSLAEAQQALAAWGGAEVPPRLIKDRENAVYEVVLAGGRRAALRLHRAGYQTAAAIRSELDWTRALAAAGLSVPEPVPTLSGVLVHEPEQGRAASVVGWVEGTPLGEAFTPLSGSVPAQIARFRAIGRLLAEMHNATDAVQLPAGFTRPRWDIEGLLGDRPFWGRFWQNPALTGDERALLQQARAAARQVLEDFRARGGDYGLIHGDLMRENLLLDGDRISLIDFDDSGFGFRLYDLGTLMIQNLDEPAFPELQAAALAGYRAARPLDAQDAALLPMFTMLRCLASCGWAVPRMAPDDPRLRDYAARAAGQARAFLAAS
ncbi:phosphotransferase enzyme family protein [Acidimangrovimonas pyrenivorans]|uniref:Phosphotransferase enzyme family protein n=1 Tax=Acidimangrovimonas pyrenivorans TaxID=2030798 RepID=A0ABV7AD68_9RHOB